MLFSCIFRKKWKNCIIRYWHIHNLGLIFWPLKIFRSRKHLYNYWIMLPYKKYIRNISKPHQCIKKNLNIPLNNFIFSCQNSISVRNWSIRLWLILPFIISWKYQEVRYGLCIICKSWLSVLLNFIGRRFKIESVVRKRKCLGCCNIWKLHLASKK